MHVSRLSPLLVSCVLASAALCAGAEDLTIVSKDGKGATQTQYFTATKMRHDMGERATMMDFASGTITNIDNVKKEYSQMTLAEMEAAMKQASAQMEQAMANVPPAMREKMEQMMGGAASSITVTKGGTKKVAGYDTQQYTISMGESMQREVWNTTALQFPFDPTQFRRMSTFSGSMAGGPMMKNAAKLAEKMQEAQGFTLAESTHVKMMGRESTTSREAVEVKRTSIPADVFTVPASYKKVDSPMLKMGQAGKR
jgi:hypothetical protein